MEMKTKIDFVNSWVRELIYWMSLKLAYIRRYSWEEMLSLKCKDSLNTATNRLTRPKTLQPFKWVWIIHNLFTSNKFVIFRPPYDRIEEVRYILKKLYCLEM